MAAAVRLLHLVLPGMEAWSVSIRVQSHVKAQKIQMYYKIEYRLET